MIQAAVVIHPKAGDKNIEQISKIIQKFSKNFEIMLMGHLDMFSGDFSTRNPLVILEFT